MLPGARPLRGRLQRGPGRRRTRPGAAGPRRGRRGRDRCRRPVRRALLRAGKYPSPITARSREHVVESMAWLAERPRARPVGSTSRWSTATRRTWSPPPPRCSPSSTSGRRPRHPPGHVPHEHRGERPGGGRPQAVAEAGCGTCTSGSPTVVTSAAATSTSTPSSARCARWSTRVRSRSRASLGRRPPHAVQHPRGVAQPVGRQRGPGHPRQGVPRRAARLTRGGARAHDGTRPADHRHHRPARGRQDDVRSPGGHRPGRGAPAHGRLPPRRRLLGAARAA